MKQSLLAFSASGCHHEADLTAQIQHASKDLRLAATKVISASFQQIINHLANNDSPSLLLVDLSQLQKEGANILQALQQLSQVCQPGTKVILFGEEITLAEYRQLINLGIEDYLTLPLVYDVLVDCLKQALGLALSKRKNNSKHIMISGLQGGVGSTTLCAALSLKLAAQGTHTLLADIDTELGDLSLFWPDLEQQAISSEQVNEINHLQRASQVLTERLSYLPLKASTETNIEFLQQKLAQQASTILWDVPRHHQLALGLWQQADVCIWVLESSISVLRHWHSIKQQLENSEQDLSHQRHIFVLNQTRKERSQQISIAALEQALQQSLIVLPYAGQQALDAANLGQADLLLKGKLGQGIDDVCAHLLTRSRSHKKPISALQQLLIPLRNIKPKKTPVA